jgi:hypothetical protein
MFRLDRKSIENLAYCQSKCTKYTGNFNSCGTCNKCPSKSVIYMSGAPEVQTQIRKYEKEQN